MKNNEFLALAVKHKIVKVPAKQLIFNKGDQADALYAIVSGSILLSDTSEVVSAPSTIGLEEVLRGGCYSNSAITAKDTSYIKVSSDKLNDYVKLCPDQAIYAIKNILGVVEKLQEAEEKGIDEITLPPVQQANNISEGEDQDLQQRLDCAKSAFGIPSQHSLYKDSIKIVNDAKFLYATDYNCPVCSTKFSEKKVLMSLLRTVKTNMDLRVLYQDFDPMWYAVVSCPKCKYSNTEKRFSDTGGYEAKNIANRLADAGAGNIQYIYKKERSIDDVFVAYYAALFCCDLLADNIAIKANIWLNLVWLYEDVGDAVMSEYASKKALECYNHIYNSTRLYETPEEEQQFFMLLAELNIRVGDKAQALNFLSAGFKSESSNRVYKDRCRKRFDDIKYGE